MDPRNESGDRHAYAGLIYDEIGSEVTVEVACIDHKHLSLYLCTAIRITAQSISIRSTSHSISLVQLHR